jgi:hypothetical protein
MKHVTVATLLMLAACQQNDPNNIAIDEGNGLDAEVETLPPDETSAANGAASADAAPPSPPDQVNGVIPAELHGRWGMVAADCTSTRGDNKGLITVTADSIRFYESVARLKEPRAAQGGGFSGLFDFTGEGQNWQKVMTFTRDGNTLRRSEEEGTFTYTRCA